MDDWLFCCLIYPTFSRFLNLFTSLQCWSSLKFKFIFFILCLKFTFTSRARSQWLFFLRFDFCIYGFNHNSTPSY
ncbi:hypothetical protein MPNB_0901 [Mycoplasmoides pneumoniae]|nr:hypothetical protein MPNB_0901 [Mycoplasmoides pneumoniae]